MPAYLGAPACLPIGAIFFPGYPKWVMTATRGCRTIASGAHSDRERCETLTMIKRLATAALAVMSLTATSLSASAAWEVWQGSLFFTTVSRACPASTARVGGFLNAVLRPNGLQGNGSNTLLALFSLANAQSYGFVGALNASRPLPAAKSITAPTPEPESNRRRRSVSRFCT